MRIPLSWLAEHVELPEQGAADWLHAQLVRVGFEEEAVHGGDLRGPIVVGRVLELVEEPQKNGKTIRWCQVDVGEANGGVRGIVCGALNFVEGDRVVVTLPGSALGDFEIAARKTYGHVSDGMIASVRELGIGDDHDGIMRLDELGIPGEVGEDALALLGLDDQAVEINVTPDRGYALSIRGIARELASSIGAPFTDPADIARSAVDLGTPSGFALAVDDQAPIRGSVGCSRFIVRVVRGIDQSFPTPAWMVSRLRLAGMRSVSIGVDITNYVMLELGQPTHAYDLGKLRGGIAVRRARAGERITTLDDVDRALSAEDLLITDDRGPIGIAGVMGGAATEMDASTTDVAIESATFDAVSIGRSSRRHRLISEASKRFERGVDPAVADAAAARVAQLLVELAGGTIDTELGAELGDVPQMAPVTIPVGYWSELTGADYTVDEARGALVAIGAAIDEGAGERWEVTPPTWRPDLVDRESVVEEVARIVGFDRIPSVLPIAPPGRGLTRAQRLRRGVANGLAAAGLTEVLVAPFVGERQARMTGAEPVRLENPLDAERAWLRTALVPGMLDTAHRNLGRGLTDLALFELGRVFHAVDGQGTELLPDASQRPDPETLTALDRLPEQPERVAVLLLGERVRKQPGRSAERYGIADAVEAAARVARTLGHELEVRQAQRAWLHPGRAAELLVGDEVVGVAGELLPSIAADADLPRVVAVAELDLTALLRIARVALDTRAIAPVPAATQDLSLVVPIGVPAGAVRAAVREGAGALLEHIALVDDYRGQGLGEGEKSLTFALRFRATDRTLTAAEASEAKLAGLTVATERFEARLRE